MVHNEHSVASTQISWAACKAYVRGQLIKESALGMKKAKERQQHLEQQIQILFRQYKESPSADILQFGPG